MTSPQARCFQFPGRNALFLGWILGALGCVASLAADETKPNYETRQVEGWTVRVRVELLTAGEAPATSQALDQLRNQLREIIRVVPLLAVEHLKKVPLWISPEYPGVPPRAEYHPNAGWLSSNSRDPAMAKGVEFTNVRIFEAETRRMPVFVLHELAHAYHDLVLGFENPEVIAAYERAKKAGLYDAVERKSVSGGPSRIERAYAMTDAKEYFAETSEAFFGENDFFPFNRADLHRYDPGMEQVLEKLWKEPAGAHQ